MKNLSLSNKFIFLFGIAAYFIVILIRNENSLSFITLVSVCTFISYMILLRTTIGMNNSYYRSSNLALTVFIYHISFVLLYYCLSYVVDGDLYVFAKRDALIYEKFSLKMKDMPFDHALTYISGLFLLDDWGAFLLMSTILKVIPSKLFLNFCYVLFSSIMSVLLFKIGRVIMPSNYAYFASLAYSASSFSVYYNSTFLKEPPFLLLITLSLYFFYMFIKKRNVRMLVLSVIVSLLILFFRPAVMFFLWISYLGYFFASNSSKMPKFVRILVIAIIVVLLSSQVSSVFDKYTSNGDIARIAAGRADEDKGITAGGFMYTVVGVGTLIGPYPTLVSPSTGTPRGPLYGAGLLYKIFLALPFWLGFYYAIKRKAYKVYPLLILVLIESISLISIQQGLELRKGIPHVCAFYLTAFWFFYQASVRKREGRVLKFLMNFSYVFIFLIVIGWNLLRK